MTSYIDTVRIELEELTPDEIAGAAPEGERQEHESVLGTVPDIARRISALAKRYARDAAMATIDLKFGAVSERKAIEERAHEASNKSSFLMDWCWAECRDAAGCWCGEIGMRAGWLLVRPAPTANKVVQDLLRRLLEE